jgi:dTDP-L-rhamnose 4-epimerase
MKVLVTGGAGFISRHLTPLLLSQGNDVIWLDNLDPQVHGTGDNAKTAASDKAVKLVVGDIRDRQACQRAIDGVEAIFHFAALTGTGQSMYQVSHYTDVNVGGTGVLWDILANEPHQVKQVLIASSRSIYGEGAYLCTDQCGQVVPQPRSKVQLDRHSWSLTCPKCGAPAEPISTPESSYPQPASLYACSKLAQEQMSLTMGKALGIPTVALRFQNVFGPGQSLSNPYTGIISIFSNQMRQNLPINIYEDGEETRDFIYVGDVADICARSLTLDYNVLVANVGSGIATKVIDLAYQLKLLWGSSSSIEVTGDFRVGDIRHNWADLTELSYMFPDWQPTPLSSGLEKFVSWAKTQDIYEDLSKAAVQELKQRNL